MGAANYRQQHQYRPHEIPYPGFLSEIDLNSVIEATLLGVIAAIAYDAGAALAGGPPLALNEVLKDIASATLGAISGQITLETLKNPKAAAVVAAFMTGFLYETLVERGSYTILRT